MCRCTPYSCEQLTHQIWLNFVQWFRRTDGRTDRQMDGRRRLQYPRLPDAFLKDNKNILQEGQVALNCSPEFCLKLTYRYLLKADHVPSDTWGVPYRLNKLGRGPLGDATYQISRILALWFQTRRFFHVFPI